MTPQITPTPNGPLQADGIPALKTGRGETLPPAETHYLCRCGASTNKPFCDGSHTAAAFSDQRRRGPARPPAEFIGKDLTVIDDLSLCAHAGACVEGAPDTFFTQEAGRRVSHPDGSPAAVVIAAIRRCPSGALLYQQGGTRVHEYFTATEIIVEKDGPYHVHRAPLAGAAQPATSDHYTLCRCGASLNKPFCDGMHAKVHFSDGSL
jgi:CDGSH-type Zn-finger protein/uncharacterized Fe-S cluster protein YjdI